MRPRVSASSEEWRSGMKRPSTLSLPKARTHSAATTELSMPPERPIDRAAPAEFAEHLRAQRLGDALDFGFRIEGEDVLAHQGSAGCKDMRFREVAGPITASCGSPRKRIHHSPSSRLKKASPRAERAEQLRIARMDQGEGVGAMEQAVPLAEHAGEPRLHASFDRGRAAPPGVLEQVIEHRALGARLGALERVNLQHLAHAVVQVIEEPAGDGAVRLAKQAGLQLAVAAFGARLVEQPVERSRVVAGAEGDAAGGARRGRRSGRRRPAPPRSRPEGRRSAR